MTVAPAQGRPGRDGLVAAYRCLAAGNLRGALAEWRALRLIAPGFVAAHIEEAVLLQRLGDAAAADARLEEAIAALPDEPALPLAHAQAAERRADWAEAARRFAALLRRSPAEPLAYAGLARALRRLGRGPEAEAVVQDGEARFPGQMPPDDTPGTGMTDADAESRSRVAFDAFTRGDLAAAGAGFALLRQGRPDRADGFVGGVMVLRKVRALAEAEVMCQACLPRFPDSALLAVAHAWCAIERQDYVEAEQRWARIRDRFPDQSEGYSIGGLALLRLGQMETAETVLNQGLARFPTDHFMLWQHAEAATAREELDEAARRWARAHAEHPHSLEIRRGAGHLATRLQWDGVQEPLLVPPPAAPPRGPRVYGTEQADLFLAFASLGQNCEFGIVQRNAGAEPLELLRWAGISPVQLLRLLEGGIAEIGRPDIIRLEIIRGEYFLFVGDYFGMHTFLPARDGHAAAEAAQLAVKMTRRMAFLRDKMLADLAAGQKIFLFQQHGHDLTDAVLRDIHVAMRKYGNATLLGVRHPAASEQDGGVGWIAEGVMVGHLAALTADPRARAPGRQEAWAGLCARALELAGRG